MNSIHLHKSLPIENNPSKAAVIQAILNTRGCSFDLKNDEGTFFAPSNIALCKYWGKRDQILNLPSTPSLSISLDQLGSQTTIRLNSNEDNVFVNGQKEDKSSRFSSRLFQFLNYFRPKPNIYFDVITEVNIPIGAGLASSACGFASLVGALDQLFDWQLDNSDLSILARLGSGSASRSFWQGFVEWQLGARLDGMDSFGIPLQEKWLDLRIGLLIVNAQQKPISSSEAMELTVKTSPFYSAWPQKHAHDLFTLKAAIKARDFVQLGATAESNALSMHALMLTAMPTILYSEPSTIELMHKIWHYRKEGLEIYFTQDAGPNLKLLFLSKDEEIISKYFPSLRIVAPFNVETKNVR